MLGSHFSAAALVVFFGADWSTLKLTKTAGVENVCEM
jgi:hypothetical protein